MRAFRQTMGRINALLLSALIISVISFSSISFADEVSTSVDTSIEPKGVGWSLHYKLSLFKAKLLRGEKKIDYLLDLSEKYITQIEQESAAEESDQVEKIQEFYAATLAELQKQVASLSEDNRLEVEQQLILQSERLSYLSETTSDNSSTDSSVQEAQVQSEHILKHISKEKKKDAILKARETNKSDEEIENETLREEKQHSAMFETKAFQFIQQAEDAILKSERKLTEKKVFSLSSESVLTNATSLLEKAKEYYADKDYLAAIEFAFEAKHAALKAQTAIGIAKENEFNAMNETNKETLPIKRVAVKSVEIKDSFDTSTKTNMLTGKVVDLKKESQERKSIVTGNAVTESATSSLNSKKISKESTASSDVHSHKKEKDKGPDQ